MTASHSTASPATPPAAPDRGCIPAVVLLSGGLDSATCLAIARRRGFIPYALTLRYGQRHGHEIDCARRVAEQIGVGGHIVLDMDLRPFGGSALTADIAVPRDRSDERMAADIPITYVPARNTIFLSLALGWAEVLGSQDIFIGANARDYSGYPDCRPVFIEAFERLAAVATRAGVDGRPVKVHAPLIDMTKAQIIQCGLELKVDYALTHSCYDPDAHGRACGHCDACTLRLRGFAEAGATDPAAYQGAAGQRQ